MQGHAENPLRERLRIRSEKCVLSPAGGNTVHRRSRDTTPEDLEATGKLSTLCSDSSEVLVFGEKWTT